MAGTPNFPSAAKRARGRTAVEPTRIFEYTGRLWHPDELLAAFPMPSPSQNAGSGAGGDEVTLPDDQLEIIRKGGDKTADRSALFHSAVAQLKRRRWSIEAITALLEKYPDGIAKKYIKRLRKEVERSYGKVAAAATGAAASAGTTSAGVGSGPAPGARTAPHIIPTIRLVDGQLPRAVDETERALLAANSPIFSRAGTLVEPVSETMVAANGRKTIIARLRAFCPDSLLEPVAEAALFQRFNRKRNLWADIDPPLQLVRMLLVRERRWTIPRVGGIITTPTLRADGSLLAAPGYDPRSELYLLPGLQLPCPTREEAPRRARTADRPVLRILLRQPARPRSRDLRPADCPGARIIANGTGLLGPRPYAWNRQELSRRRHRHDQHRPAVSCDHNVKECGRDRKAHWLGAPKRDTDRLPRQLCPRSCRRTSLSADRAADH